LSLWQAPTLAALRPKKLFSIAIAFEKGLFGFRC